MCELHPNMPGQDQHPGMVVLRRSQHLKSVTRVHQSDSVYYHKLNEQVHNIMQKKEHIMHSSYCVRHTNKSLKDTEKH